MSRLPRQDGGQHTGLQRPSTTLLTTTDQRDNAMPNDHTSTTITTRDRRRRRSSGHAQRSLTESNSQGASRPAARRLLGRSTAAIRSLPTARVFAMDEEACVRQLPPMPSTRDGSALPNALRPIHSTTGQASRRAARRAPRLQSLQHPLQPESHPNTRQIHHVHQTLPKCSYFMGRAIATASLEAASFDHSGRSRYPHDISNFDTTFIPTPILSIEASRHSPNPIIAYTNSPYGSRPGHLVFAIAVCHILGADVKLEFIIIIINTLSSFLLSWLQLLAALLLAARPPEGSQSGCKEVCTASCTASGRRPRYMVS